MKYKMLVLDMDGTLLKDDKKISEKNKSALKAAADKGVKIIISTGRIFVSARIYGEMLELDTPIIASNGAFIKDKNSENVIYEKKLEEKNIRAILKLAHEYNINCHFYTRDTVFSEELIYASLNYSKWNKQLPEDKKVIVKIVKRTEWEDIINKNKNTILKSVITGDDPEVLKAIRMDVSKLEVEIANSYSNNFEIMNIGVSKGSAVEILAKIYNITKEEIICIGDSENDISMIKYAGLGIAMDNAQKDVKNIAKFITLSNEDDGVAYAIEKFMEI